MINPIFASASKRQMRTVRTPILVTLYGVFMLLVSLTALNVLASPTVRVMDMRKGVDTYIYLAAIQFVLILLVAPALTSGSIAGERERQTMDLLLCTRMGPLRIVVGKLLSSASFFLLLIISSLPAMGIVFLFGGITLSMLLHLMLLLMVTALAALSVGLFASALFKRTVTATVVSYLMIFVIGIGTVVYPLMFQYSQLNNLVSYARSGVYMSSVPYSASSIGSIAVIGQDVASAVAIPKLFYVNPALALVTLLVEQTNVLNSTLNSIFYGFSDVVHVLGNFSSISMAVMFILSVLLTLLAALAIRPRVPRMRRRKS